MSEIAYQQKIDGMREGLQAHIMAAHERWAGAEATLQNTMPNQTDLMKAPAGRWTSLLAGKS